MEKFQDPPKPDHSGFVDTSESAVARPISTRRDRVVARLAACLGIVSLIFLAFSWGPISISDLKLPSCHRGRRHPDASSLEAPLMGPLHEVFPPARLLSSNKVPLEAHVMSKCPDARDCLQQLVLPAMEQISDKVDFDLSFIASVSNKSSEIQCMHGPTECIGDMLILCAANLPFPRGADAVSSTESRTPTIRSLGFANCLISSYHDIPKRELVEQCALEHGIDFEALNRCASQENDDPDHDDEDRLRTPLSGIALLRKSALHSEKLGVKRSCTLRVNNTVWCVRDGGVWKDCAQEGQGSKVSALVDEVKKLWEKAN
ncbi:gamma interferon inducible lysosomal thiol reductase [Aspergillus heteromorphus CBS 117.55]|uniref:Gamma interferon inducible lysosomal thiol reductase n=1 Tax=Aspergillus heteromorphus CBS 117.55 TaxID=1448321 RepID=A0A317WUQ3_9EURO|nr:gamma interferon inducible lysosomal thiol reductase [Aspergillus heteromorphus CBS 117.55]PWY89032.1 gamma interferon inducible lysosomal thiol reductase [Aspergillus heteromorphus CBS 117.55]